MNKWWWLFLGPLMIAFGIGFLWPFSQGLYLAFCDYRLVSEAEFTGIDNFVKAFSDAGFRYSFIYTAIFTLVSMTLINVLAFIAAYYMAREISGFRIFRTIIFMPNLIGGIVLGYIWSMIFDGLLSHMGTSLIMETRYGFWGLIIMLCWQQIGYVMIIYVAGFLSLDKSILEASRIDGAGEVKNLFSIIIPNLRSTVSICCFITLSNGFKLFDQNIALTSGMPYTINADGSTIRTTEMLALNIYNTFYGQSSFGHGVAQAKAVIFFVLVAAIGLIQIKLTNGKE